MGSGNRDELGRGSTVRLVLFETWEAWEFVTDFDYSVSVIEVSASSSPLRLIVIGHLLVGLEKEPVFTIIDYRHVFISSRFFWGQSDMSKHPSLRMSDAKSGTNSKRRRVCPILSSIAPMCTYFWDTLVVEIHQSWAPSTSCQNHLICMVLGPVHRLNTDASDIVGGKERLLESASTETPRQSKIRALLPWGPSTYRPKPKLTPWSFRYCPTAFMALAAASQPPSPQSKPFHP